MAEDTLAPSDTAPPAHNAVTADADAAPGQEAAPGGEAAPAGESATDSDGDTHDSELTRIALATLTRVVESMGGSTRAGQIEMVTQSCAAIEKAEHLLVQAGTGTGKSLGYLVPALTYSALDHKRALISTATLALQRQILVKDAPTVVDAIAHTTGRTMDVALLKGWANYLCLHKLTGGYPGEEGTLFDGADAIFDQPSSPLGREIMRIRQWAKTTETGDRDDLVPGVSDRAWRHVSLQRRECLGKSCPMLDECFPQAARDHAQEADLIITNHSLLGIHATSEGDIFPEIDLMIVDEAHELAERVRDQASQEISLGSLMRVARTARTQVKADVQALEEAATAIGAILETLDDGLILNRPDNLDAAMHALDGAVRDCLSQVSKGGGEAAAKQLARAALEELLGVLDAWSRPAEHSITWVNRPWRDGEIGAPQLIIAPLDVAFPMGTVALGDRPAILTSATLSLGNSFETIAYQTGLKVSSRPWRGIDVGTPFEPDKQGIMYLPTHLPEPGPQGPSEAALRELVDLANASGGGVLALFSSWRGVEAGAAALRENTDFEILVHGEESVAALVQRFRDNRDSCLVGTMTFWQGVDVVGPACRLVVIDRIPFPRPDDPVAQARARDAERRGQSGFYAVSLTHAALMMAQASGRLLRSHEDRGMVAVLDRRLTEKKYGSYIRASMPPMWPTQNKDTALGALARLREGLD